MKWLIELMKGRRRTSGGALPIHPEPDGTSAAEPETTLPDTSRKKASRTWGHVDGRWSSLTAEIQFRSWGRVLKIHAVEILVRPSIQEQKAQFIAVEPFCFGLPGTSFLLLNRRTRGDTKNQNSKRTLATWISGIHGPVFADLRSQVSTVRMQSLLPSLSPTQAIAHFQGWLPFMA